MAARLTRGGDGFLTAPQQLTARTSLYALLRQRGLVPARCNPSDHLFLPDPLPHRKRTRLLQLWKDYGFRLLLRDILKSPESVSLSALTHYCAPEAAERFLLELVELGLVENRGGDRYTCLVGDSSSFGVTLEWFLSEIIAEEFAAPTLWGVRIRGTGLGDFDVLATLGDRLLYTEAKSSPPKHIHHGEVMAFWHRLESLRPDMAIYFVDTHLRMKDKIVILFEQAIRELGLDREKFAVKRLHDEIFHIQERIFIANSHRSVVGNLRRCIRMAGGGMLPVKETKDS